MHPVGLTISDILRGYYCAK